MNDNDNIDYGGVQRTTGNGDVPWTKHLRPAVVSTLVLTLLLGGFYPLAVWAIGRLPGLRHKADGSLIVDASGQVRGSKLIGQTFTGAGYFHSRPSGAGSGYDASLSSGTNWGPTNAKLVAGIPDDPATKDVDESVPGVPQLAAAYRTENGLKADEPIPADAVTRSASGLDPHISVRNAELQVTRVARERGLSPDQVLPLVRKNTDRADLALLGEAGVNVLLLNLDLNQLKPLPASAPFH